MLRISTFSSFQYRDFRFLWGSMVFSSSGQWMEQVALSWLVWDLTNDPLMLGLINGARAIPFLLSPLGGVAADRIDRKLLMQGVSKVESAGQQFDPNVHEAIQSVPTVDHPEGTITTVVRDGYMLNDRLLRPAQVVVAVSAALEDETETTT